MDAELGKDHKNGEESQTSKKGIGFECLREEANGTRWFDSSQRGEYLSGGRMAVDKNMKILVVDDFATMRRIVKNILTQLGFKNIIEADDGTTAIKALQEEKVDLIISDWNMPKMTGLEFLEAVRAESKWAKIPFIMVTAEAQQDNIILAVKARVSQYIVKPFTADTLGEKIQKIFG